MPSVSLTLQQNLVILDLKL